MSMNVNTPQLLIPSIESVGSQAIINSRPQLPICDHQFEHRSLKRPRDSQTTLNLRRTALIKRQPQRLKFKRGYCNFEDNCHFSHGQELLAKHGEDNHTIISRMRLCWRFCNGEECLYGDRCHFLHEIPEKFRGDSGISTKNCRINVLASGTYDEPERFVKRNGLNPNQVHQRSGGWKTRLCNKWETTGQCSYGLRCYFAHGSGELRRLATHNTLESRNISISKTLATTARDESSSKTGSGTKRQQVLGERCLFKWKEVERISGIYADWVDDMPLENGSPGKVDH